MTESDVIEFDSIGKEKKLHSITINGEAFYCGEYWFDRFKKALEKEFGDNDSILPIEDQTLDDLGTWGDVLEAAHKASGIDKLNI